MVQARTALVTAAVLALAACGETDDTIAGGTGTVQDDPPAAGSEPVDDPSGPDDTVRPPEEPTTTRAADPMDGGTVVPPADPPSYEAPSTDPPASDPPLTVRTDPPAKALPTSTLPPPAGDVEVPAPGGPLEQARADLASRLSVPVDAVAVVSSEEVTWSDGSLGCPQPGMAYTQALVNGMRIVLEVDGATYEYHSGGTGTPFYCADPAPPAAGGPGYGYGDT